MNPGLKHLHPYPFEKLTDLKRGIDLPMGMQPIDLSIGEPKHTTPQFILEVIQENLDKAASYPTTRGLDELRETICRWLYQRFAIADHLLSPDKNVLPVNGTREAIFAFAQCVIASDNDALVLMPNPFYQIYEGAALLAGAKPYYLNCTEDNDYIPDFKSVPEEIWQRCRLVYTCSPGNPTGKVMDKATLQGLFELSDRYGFIIAADECYSEIYFDEQQPPMGLLQAAVESGRDDFRNCVVFHSLSKRSNVPGIRSGFIAGDADLIQAFLRYRTYHGCAMSLYTQLASIAAWQDEVHVRENRDLYRQKFESVLNILQPVLHVTQPDAAFYLWPLTPVNDTVFARDLYQHKGVTVLPGSFLSRTSSDINPGENHVRIALVASEQECLEAANRILDYIQTL